MINKMLKFHFAKMHKTIFNTIKFTNVLRDIKATKIYMILFPHHVFHHCQGSDQI